MPPQARDLYLRNPVRGLADAAADPVPLTPRLNPLTGRDLDLSFALLRALSPVHREYLGNMGVRASLSASITLEGRLWGLLACHHAEPLPPASTTVGFLGGMADPIAAHVAVMESREWAAGMAKGQELLRRLPQMLEGESDWAAALVSEEAGLMEALHSDGIALLHEGRVSSRGAVPPEADIRRLAGWLAGRDVPLFFTNQLGIDVPELAGLASVASGLAAIPLHYTEGGWILWFRPEVAATVRWAGDPRKGVVEDSGGRRLTPRKSFAAWVEAVRGRSRHWTIVEKAIAGEAVRANLMGILASWQRRQIKGLSAYQGILFEQVDDSVVVTDVDGKITFWNDASTRLHGWTREEMVGQTVIHGSPPEYARQLGQILKTVMATGEYLGDLLAVRKDGSRVWVHLRWQSLRGPDGAPLGMVCIGRDISASKQAEAELRSSEERFRFLVEGLADPLCLHDQTGRILDVNPSASTALGYTREELLRLNVADIDATSAPRDLAARWEGLLDRPGNPVTFGSAYRRKDGSTFAAEIRESVVQAGETPLFLRSLRDVTEQVRITQNLSLQAQVLESMAEGVILCDDGGVILQANPAEHLMFGYGQGELVGQNAAILNDGPPEEYARVYSEIWEALAAGVAWSGEWRNRRKDGTPFTTSVRITSFTGANGKPHIVCVQEDISERKRAEGQLRFQHALLRCQTEASPDGILVVTPDGRILAYNRRFIDVWGIPEEVVAAGDDAPVLALARGLAADPDAFSARVAAINAAPDANSLDEVALADGRTLDRYSGPIRGEKGELLGRVWYFRDVTERKRAELERQDRESQLRALGDNLPQGAVYQMATTPVGARRVTYVSAGIERLLGVTPAQVTGDTNTLLDLVLDQDRARLQDAELRAFMEWTSFDCEFRSRTRSGEVKWLQARSAPRGLPGGPGV